jgi:hypothetical protein
MVDQRRDKRFRVSGEDADGDVHAFETDSRERAEAQKLVFEEDLQNVTLDRMRRP